MAGGKQAWPSAGSPDNLRRGEPAEGRPGSGRGFPAGEIAVIAALAITILVKIGPAHYSAAVLSPSSSPNQRLTDLTDAMIYGFTAFAGFEAAAALGEEATNARRSVPVSIVGVVVVTGIMYTMGRERALPGSIRAFRTEFRHEFRPVPHLPIPAAASVVFLFPLWGILFPGAYTLANLLPFISLGWLLIGAIAAGIPRARRPVTFRALGGAVAPNLDKQLEPD
jgi:hypothetical protein